MNECFLRPSDLVKDESREMSDEEIEKRIREELKFPPKDIPINENFPKNIRININLSRRCRDLRKALTDIVGILEDPHGRSKLRNKIHNRIAEALREDQGYLQKE